ncbi:uncharacterized protein LOC129777767 [Toxorhynchites rutilus septentrionalis]|uniref:uncharacterized protein LOC129777767 n=1 Tax=Toxorhynchites rutilus septentrionalis TaxID=329112 RepID=UPI002478ED0B|nr:uncharacterized protein LOC129777767 [Toxorhynchites rutilus septentrionalis]
MFEGDINDLPSQVLCEMFDRLSLDEQNIAKGTCKLWLHILSSDYYLRARRFILCPENTSCGEDETRVWNLKKMKRYRSFAIRDATVTRSTGSQFWANLRTFLSTKKVMLHIEDLQLRMHNYSLGDVLGFVDPWSFPSLKTISYRASVWIDRVDIYPGNLRAPKLRHLQLEDANMTIALYVMRFSEQIDELTVRFSDKFMLFRTIADWEFSSVRSLTLCTTNALHLPKLIQYVDFGDRHMRIFARLNYLKISDKENIFFSAYKDIFRASRNLETLIVEGHEMCEDSFNAIGGLRRLKELCLLVDIHRYWDLRKLSLLELVTLTTYVGVIAPLRNAPKLKRLYIKNKILRGKYMFAMDDRHNTYIRAISQKLEYLHIHGVELDDTLCNQICELTNLKTLIMEQVEVQDGGIRQILRTLYRLQSFHLIRCKVVKMVSVLDHFRNARLAADEGFADEDNMDFLEDMKCTYPRCEIATVDNKLEIRFHCELPNFFEFGMHMVALRRVVNRNFV